MSDEEFDTLDELYFIQTFDGLLSSTGLNEPTLKEVLIKMLERGWIRIFLPVDSEVVYSGKQFVNSYRNYHYIASKAGLMAHHGREGEYGN